MIKKILLTGATGFIGSFLLERLLEEKYEVVILKRSTSDTWRIDHLLDRVAVYDIDHCELGKPFDEHTFDCVMHLATKYIKFNESIADVAEMIDFNVNTAAQLCELAVKRGVKYFLNTGTMTEYTMKDTPIKEGDPRVAYNFFSSTKVAFDAIVQTYASLYDMKVIDLKLFAPFGERDQPKVTVFLTKCVMEGRAVDFSGGEQRWNFTYVRDIVEAYMAALPYFEKSGKYESFNIGCSEPHSMREIVAILENISGKKSAVNFGAKPYIDNEIMYVNCDPTKAKEKLGWQPKYSLEDALKIMYDYYTEHSQ